MEAPGSKWPVSSGKEMASTSFRMVSYELETDRHSGAGETRRQEDRPGTLAVKSGPPTRGSGGVADSVRPLRMDDSGRQCAGHAPTIGQIRPVSRGIPHRTHFLLSQAGS